MTDKLFNTPFELSLHILLLLDSVDGGFTIERITDYDFIAVYAPDFGFKAESLNGDNGFAFSELTAKRKLMKAAIKGLVLDGLVAASDSMEGIIYTLSSAGRSMSKSFQSDYAARYRKVIKQVHRRYWNKSEVELSGIINKQSTKELRRR
jgi:hypothetical protein